MAGHLYKRGDIWWGRLRADGKEIARSLDTGLEGLARKRLESWARERAGARWGERPALALNAAADLFVREHGPTLRPATLERYGVSLEHLTRAFGGRPLAEIGKADLAEFESARRQAGAAPPTIRRDLACLSSILTFAIERDLAEANPVAAFLKSRRRRGLPDSAPRTRWLTLAEEAALVAQCRRAQAEMIRFAIDTGLRRTEQTHLVWDEVDLARGVIVIPPGRAKKGRERQVALLPRAAALLAGLPRHPASPYVFWRGMRFPGQTWKGRATASEGDPYLRLEQGLKAAAKRAGLRPIIWHDLRRTHGCRLLQDHGWTLDLVRDQLGHSSVAQTERAYAFLKVEQRTARLRGGQSGGQPPPEALKTAKESKA